MRWRFKIPLIGVVAIAVVILIGLFLLYESHLLESWVNRYMADKIADKYHLDITIEDIDGSFVDGFVLRDILVRFYPEGDTVTLAFVPRLEIDYSISDLWHRRWVVDSLKIAGAEIYLERESSGRWKLPDISAEVDEDAAPPSWDFKHILLTDAAVNLKAGESAYGWFGVGLRGSAKSDGGTYTMRIDSLRADSDDRRLRVREAFGQATLFEGNLAVQDVRIIGDSSDISFSAVYNAEADPSVTADISSAHVRLPDVLSLFGPRLRGAADFSGSVYGRDGRIGGNLMLSGQLEGRLLDSLQVAFHYDDGLLYFDSLRGRVFHQCRVHGYGRIDFASRPEAYSLSAEVDSFNLTHLVFDSFESDLSGRLDLNGRGFKSETMAIDITMDLDESWFDIYHVTSASGQMTVGNKGLYAFPGFHATYYDNRFFVDGGIDYDGNVTIGGWAELNDLSDFARQIFIDLPAGRASAEFAMTGPIDDPHIRAVLKSDSIWLYDFFSSDFESSFFIQNFMTSMSGPLLLTCRGGDAWGFPYDSIYAEFTLDSNFVYIDTGHIVNEFSRADVAGVLDFEKYPQGLFLDTVIVDLKDRRFVSDGVQSILIDSVGYLFERISIAATDGKLAFSGRVNYDETLDLTWEIENVSVSPWVELLNDSLEVGGRLSSTGQLSGTTEYPEFEVDVWIDSLAYRSLFLGNLRAYTVYGDSALTIDSMYLVSTDGRYTATGDFPINLSMTPGHKLFDGRQQDIRITAVDKRLDLASFLLESVEYITGDFSADFDLTGTPAEPHLNGICFLRNGTVKVFDLRDQLRDVEVELEMSDRLVTIRKAEAVVPRRGGENPGRVWGRGTILIHGLDRFRYAINVQCTDLPIKYELGDVTGLVDARVWVNGETPPTVSGTIVARQMYYRESFEETGFSMLSALEADKTWDLDLMVEFPSKFWVKNDDIDAEFSGDINILREDGTYNFLGSLEVIRGKYFFFDKTFRMEPGGRIIYDDIAEPDPKLDLAISTRIRTANRFSDFESESSYSYELNLTVTGTLNNPIISGAGETPISNENILPALLADYNPGLDSLGGNPVLADRITVGGVGLLASQFSRFGTRTLGVETFEIYPTGAKGFDPLSTRLTIGAYTLPNLYIFGSSYFDVNRGQEVGLEYRLGRHYLFEGRRDESNLYHFNLKLHYEFDL